MITIAKSLSPREGEVVADSTEQEDREPLRDETKLENSEEAVGVYWLRNQRSGKFRTEKLEPRQGRTQETIEFVSTTRDTSMEVGQHHYGFCTNASKCHSVIDTIWVSVDDLQSVEKVEPLLTAGSQELSRVHNTFHVSNLKKCYLTIIMLFRWKGLQVDDKLHFVEGALWKFMGWRGLEFTWNVKINSGDNTNSSPKTARRQVAAVIAWCIGLILTGSIGLAESKFQRCEIDPSMVLKKRYHDDKDKDPSADSEKGKKKRRQKDFEPSKDKEPTDSSMKDDVVNVDEQPQADADPKPDNSIWFKQDVVVRPETLDSEWYKEPNADDALKQNRFNELVNVEKDPLTFDDLMGSTVDFTKFSKNRLKKDKITKADLQGSVFMLLKGTCRNNIELEYNLEQCYLACQISLIG
ncbi:hypothetical protein Tco_0308900 [Tanacetum coccineum]